MSTRRAARRRWRCWPSWRSLLPFLFGSFRVGQFTLVLAYAVADRSG